MYYKDDNVEIRLGLGFKAFVNILPIVFDFVLTKLDTINGDTIIETFTSDTNLTAYPVDGDYSLEISSETIPAYLIYININDSFIIEFINQIKDVVCGCDCKPCLDNGKVLYANKRQKMFNTTFILPNTIKPFSYGQVSTTNSFLSNFIQLYFNETILDKKTELGKEYFNYYITGSTDNNGKLFNTIIAAVYYSLYYYYKFLILINTDSNYPTIQKNYIKIVSDFFNITDLTSCLHCYIAGVNFDVIASIASNTTDLVNVNNQNNFSRSITVLASNLSGNGTLYEQIAEYVNTLSYYKDETDSEVWINYIDDVTP